MGVVTKSLKELKKENPELEKHYDPVRYQAWRKMQLPVGLKTAHNHTYLCFLFIYSLSNH